MHLTASQLNLSPSDVTAFLACEHLTTLSLAHARGEVGKPEVEDEQRDLIFRKGLEHEHAYLQSVRAVGLTVLEISVCAAHMTAPSIVSRGLTSRIEKL